MEKAAPEARAVSVTLQEDPVELAVQERTTHMVRDCLQ